MKTTARCFRMIVLLLVALAFFLPGIPGPLTARAATCTVTTNADSGPGSLRDKVGDASCDAIVFAGDYTITLASQLTIDRSVTIDGTGYNVTVSGNNSVRVFIVSSGVTFNLNRMTVRNGSTTGDGGGIFADESTVTVTDSHFSGNTGDWGGGIAIYFGTLTVTNSTFSGNTADRGGGIYTYNFGSSGTVTVANSTFSGNRATYGGGFRANYSSVTVSNSTFSANDASDSGGGIITTGGTLTVTNSTFSGNIAHGYSGGGGGGIDNGGTLLVTNSTFSRNLAPDSFGGGIYNNGSATAKNVILDDNCPGFNCAGAAMSGFNNLSSDYGCGESFAHSPSIGLGTLGNYGGNTQTLPLLPGSSAINAGHSATCADPATVNNLDQRGLARPAGQCDIGAFEFYRVNTTTSLTSLPNPSNTGQSVTFTAQVNESAPGAPTGIVTFKDGVTTLGTGAIDGAGQATLSTSDLVPGTHAITAEYSGDAAFEGSTSPEVSLVVRFNTTTTLSSSANPSPGPVTFTATVAPTPNGGTVTLKKNGADIAGCVDVSVSAGQATCTTGVLARGGNAITAVYSGYGSYLASMSPILIQAVYARPAIGAGGAHTCEVQSGGALVCWGDNSDGQLSIPSTSSPWMQVSNGGSYTCGVKADGTLACWGYNYNGQTNVPSPNENWIQVSAGYDHTCGVKADGTITCWGWNAYGQTDVPGPNENWTMVGNGYIHTCGLKTDGTIVCWGDNSCGQRNVPSPNTNWVQVTAGYTHNCGLKADGSLVCWGDNGVGQNNVPSPNTNWVQAAPGASHTCGVKSDGTLACWGSNHYGQLNVPNTISPWTQVAAGGRHSCGLKGDGTIACWEWNDRGQAPVVTLDPATLPNALLGSSYAHNLSASGGTAAPYTFSVVAGSPPTGLTLNADGTWSGAPASTGTFNLTAQAVDAHNVAGTRDYTLAVQAEDTYADPVELCGGNIPCFSSLQAAIDAASSGYTVTVYGGAYDEPVALDRNVTVILAGDVTLGGGFLQSSGTFSAGSRDLTVGGDMSQTGGSLTAPAGTLTLAGDFTRSGGTFDPNNGTLRLLGLGDQALDPGGATLDNLAIDEGLLGYWKFDEGSGGTAHDSSGSGWHGGLVDGPAYTTDRAPLSFANPYALAFDLDGSNDYVFLPDAAGRRPTVFSWSLWVQWAGLGSDVIHFLTAKSVGNYELHTGGAAGVNGLRFIPAGAATLVDAPDALHAGWNHVVAVYTGTGAYLYVDGVLTAARTGISGGNDLTAVGEPILLGVRSGGDYPFVGALDDVRLYNRALTSSEVAALYAGERGLAGYWKLDEGSGTVASDSSGHGQSGTLNGSPAWTTAGLPPLSFADPAALSFGSMDDHVGGPAAHLPTGSHALTVLAWIRTTATARETAFSYGAADTAQAVSLNVNQLAADGHLVIDFYGDCADSGVAVNDGDWHQVGFSLGGHSTAIVLYIDGVAYPRTLAIQPNVAAGTSFQIGRWVTSGPGDTGPYSFAGDVDDVRVYDRALSAAEMARLYAGGEARNRVALSGDLALGGSFVQSSGVFAGGSGAVTIDGELTLAGGSFTAPAGVLSLSGNLAYSGGTFAHNNGTVTLGGGGVQTVSGSPTFYDVTVNPGTTVDLGLEPLFRVDGALDNDGALRQTRPTPAGTATEFLHVLDGAGGADRYRGLTLEPAGNMGSTTGTVFGNQWCPNVSAGVRRCFEILPGTQQTAAVTFYLAEAEREGQNLGDLHAWHWTGSSWERQMGATTWGGSGDGQWVQVEGIASYSPFLLAGNSPTAVVLDRFEARPEGAGQRLQWQTISEVAVMGFHLYRSEAADGRLTRLNEALVPAQAPGSPSGAAYSFLDGTAVPGVSYYYWLDVVEIHGGATRHGPAIAAPWGGASHVAYLPLLGRKP